MADAYQSINQSPPFYSLAVRFNQKRSLLSASCIPLFTFF
jgi:hypothetical protein